MVLAAVLGLSALALLYCLAYPNTLKPLATGLTERFLERELVIDGDLDLELSLTPEVSAVQIRFANAPGTEAPWMATAEYARVRIDLPGLFENGFRLLDLEVRGAELNLEDSVDGRPNWVFFEPRDDGAPWAFTIERLSISDSRLSARIGELEPIAITIPRLEESMDPEGHLTLDGHGSLNGDPWRIDGRIGPLEALLAAGRIELDMDLVIDDTEISARGSIGELASLSEFDLRLRLYGPDAELLGRIFQMPEAFVGDIALEAAFHPADTGHAIDVKGHIAEFQITTTGTIADLKYLDGWDGDISVTGPDAGVFGKAMQIEGFPDGPFEVRGSVHRHGGDLDLKNVVINTEDAYLTLDADFAEFPRRKGALGTLSLSGDDLSEFRTLLRLPELPAIPFQASLSLDATGNEVLTSTLKVGSNTVTAAGAIGEFPDFTGTELIVRASGTDIAEPLLAFGVEQPFSGRYRLETRFVIDPEKLELRQSVLEIDGHQVRGDVSWPAPLTPDRVDFEGGVSIEDLANTGSLFGAAGLPSAPLTSTGRLRFRDGALTLEDSRTRLRGLELVASGLIGRPGHLPDMDLDLRLTGPNMESLFHDAIPNGDQSVPFTLVAQARGLENGIDLRSFKLETAGGTFNAAGILSFAPGGVGSKFSLEGQGEKLSAVIPAFPSYRPPDEPWRLKADVDLERADHFQVSNVRIEIGSVTMKMDGTLDAVDQSQTSLTFAASGDRISDIGQIGEVLWPEYPFDIKTELERTQNTLLFRSLTASWGDSDVTGEGKVILGERPFVEIRGRSEILDIYDLQHALFGEQVDEEPADDRKKIFPDTPIPMQFFADYEAVVNVEVEHFRGRNARLEDVKLELDVEDGALYLSRATYRDDIGYFDAKGLLRPEGDGVYMELLLAGKDADLGFFSREGQSVESAPRYSLDVDIWGNGRTVAELVGNLNGKLLISSDGGQIRNDLLQAFAGDFVTNVLETLNPFVKAQTSTPLECLVLNAALRGGKLDLTPGFVMRTDRLNTFVYGKADLKSETLDLSLATQARQGIGLSPASITNPYFKVGGTFVTPALQLDPTSAAVAASVATATAGLSILFRGVFDRLMGTRNPCPDFLKFEQKLPERPTAESSTAAL
jgi:hypothetical protein